MPGDARKWSQWDFSSLEDWEVEHCWAYEFTRLVPGLVSLVKAWQAQVPRKKRQDRFNAYLMHQGGRVTPFIKIEDRTFMIPLGAYYLFPEWPDHYLKIPSKVRFRRLKKLWEHEKDWLEPQEAGRNEQKRRRKRAAVAMELREIDPHPAEYGLDPIIGEGALLQTSVRRWDGGAFNRFVDSLMKNICSKKGMRVFRSDAEVLAILRIDWTRSDNELVALFWKWLARNRPKSTAFRRQGRTGRNHPLPKKRTELDYLRKYLIVEDAGTWKINVGQVPLFRDRFKYNACCKAVKKILDGLHPGPIAPV